MPGESGKGPYRVMLDGTFELLDIPARDIAPDEGDRFDSIAITFGDAGAASKAPDGAARPEPRLKPPPFFIDFDEPPRLDPERSGLTWELPPAVAEWAVRWRAPLVSLAAHLLPVIAIILMPLLLIEPPPPIPVQLVFEEPPPPPKPQPQPPQMQPPKMEVGRLSSVDMGTVKQQDTLGRTADPVQQPSAGQQQPDPSANAATPPPVPSPKPVPPKERQSAFLLPNPSGAKVQRHDDTPREAAHTARYAGMAATRDEYLAYLVSLTRQHIGLLPMSFIGDRRGETVISVIVYDNGRIGPLGVAHSSGYPDIDQRIEQMVGAVGKFPPLPQWYQGNAVQLELTLKFPEALERSQ